MRGDTPQPRPTIPKHHPCSAARLPRRVCLSAWGADPLSRVADARDAGRLSEHVALCCRFKPDAPNPQQEKIVENVRNYLYVFLKLCADTRENPKRPPVRALLALPPPNPPFTHPRN